MPIQTPGPPSASPALLQRARARGLALLASLDDEQRAAVLATTGPTLVVGGPGTGKTRLLAHRMAYLCAAEGIPPRRQLVFTYSAFGTDLIRARAERLLGSPLHGAWMGTFSAIAQRIVRAHASEVGRDSKFTILSEAEARTLVRRVARELGLDPDQHPPTRLSEAISAAKMQRSDASREAGVLADVFRAYEHALAEANALDADDVLLYSLRLLDEREHLRLKYRRRFEHIHVDEFQDITHPQMELLRALGAPSGNVACVADDDQAIRPFESGASPLDELQRVFEGVKVFPLTHNYRSSGRILHVAGRLIRHNAGRLEKALVPLRKHGPRVVALTLGDEREEAAAVVGWIERMARHGETSLSRTAIMYRQEIQARPFEEALIERGIPYRVAQGRRFYERREIKDIMSYLRLAVGGGDPLVLARVANVPRRGIGPASVGTIARLTRSQRISLAEAALRAAQLPRVTAQRAGALADLGRLLKDLEDAALKCSALEMIDYVVMRTGYDKMLEELAPAEEEARREGIDELRGLARAHSGPAVDALPALFARAARAGALPWEIEDREDDRDERTRLAHQGEGGVLLLTYPAAKERELDTVFMTGLEEGLLPHVRSLASGETVLAAERRLCYVAMVRARNRLLFTHALSRSLSGQARGNPPSRFIAEAGRRVRRFRLGSARPGFRAEPGAELGAKPGAKPGTKKVEPPPPSLLVVRAGQRVMHPKYGAGLVTKVEETLDNPTVTVLFDAHGEKRLRLALARLAPA
ncbi:MAG: UvrD-helicase domain-containing protein [Deltaproteobacteria bacterium]|nr:UvrD-helicase domain-containing protein [Deltaproteobacteria bacterium]